MRHAAISQPKILSMALIAVLALGLPACGKYGPPVRKPPPDPVLIPADPGAASTGADPAAATADPGSTTPSDPDAGSTTPSDPAPSEPDAGAPDPVPAPDGNGGGDPP
jgi:hypothetical protein